MENKYSITHKKAKTAPKQGIIPINMLEIAEPIINENPPEIPLNMDVANLIPEIQAIMKEPTRKKVIIKKRKQPIENPIETIK